MRRQHFVRIASVRPEEEKAVEERTHVADTFGKLGRVDTQLTAMFLSTESNRRDQRHLLRNRQQGKDILTLINTRFMYIRLVS